MKEVRGGEVATDSDDVFFFVNRHVKKAAIRTGTFLFLR